MKLLMALCLLLTATLFCGALSAQNIEVEQPVGIVFASGGTVDLGDNPDRNTQTVTILIRNSHATQALTFSGSGTPGTYLVPSGAQRVDFLIQQPGSATLTAGQTVTLDIDVTPNAKGDWQLLISIPSDATNEANYTMLLKGSAGKEDDDDDCSTHEGSSGTSILMLFAALSAALVAVRLRHAHA